jgi:hypothetical protein
LTANAVLEFAATEVGGLVLIVQPPAFVECHVREIGVPVVTLRLPLVPFNEKSVIVVPPLLLAPAAHVVPFHVEPEAQATVTVAELREFDVP